MDWSWATLAVAVVSGLLLLWAGLIVALWLNRPDDVTIGEALRLLPDVIRLLRRIAADPTLPRGVRIRLWLLLAYLAMPLDVVPDFIPVLGFADDAIIMALALRSVTRLAGGDALDQHWPGSATGLAAIRRLARLR